MNKKEIISQMSLEEKASLTSGLGAWHTKPVERLGVKSIMMTDGPHGLRKMAPEGTVKSTCFTTAAGLACSWNTELIAKVGRAIAEEAIAEGVSIVLGPGVNMKRSPLCGRNFEYFSEDPYLAGKLASNYVSAVQSMGVGTSLKHFAVNNQETRRFSVSENLDERTLREIYLSAFETVVKEAQPATIMESYNRINGRHACESKWLLTDILRKEWGFEGYVMSDWQAINDRVEALKAGTELEMPASLTKHDKDIVDAVKEGRLDENVLDQAVERLLHFFEKYGNTPAKPYDADAHHALAAELACECMVLLKNEGGILPLADKKPLAVLGEFAKKPRYQGSGSSRVNPLKIDNVFDFISARNGEQTYFESGYSLENDDVNEELIEKAVQLAEKCGRAIIFVGLPDKYEAEGTDRRHMRMPASHNRLVEAVVSKVSDVCVVLMAGSPAELPWVGKVPALLHAYLGGQALGDGIAKITFGDVNPSGKLAETHPVKLEDTPSYTNFPGYMDDCNYGEGIYIGYRHYEKKKIPVTFPFGFGLSYTSYAYESIAVDKNTVTVKVKNIGKRDGSEIVQLYIADNASKISRPVKELKGFKKVFIPAGESREITFELNDRSFAYYDVNIKAWQADIGDYTVYVGGSSADTPLNAKITRDKLLSEDYIPINRNTVIADLVRNPHYRKVAEFIFDNLFFENYYGDDKAANGPFEKNKIVAKHMRHVLRQLIYYNPNIDEKIIESIITQANEQLSGK